jgi:glucose-6-phosphate 1-dehydrogenase
MEADRHPNPSVFVIFGAGGDLTGCKLVPALYNLFLDGCLPDKFQVLGLDLGQRSDDQFRDHLRQGVDKFSRRGKSEEESWKTFATHLHFIEADLSDSGIYWNLARRLDETDKQWDFRANRTSYLALPPTMIEPVTHGLADAQLNQDRRRALLPAHRQAAAGENLRSVHSIPPRAPPYLSGDHTPLRTYHRCTGAGGKGALGRGGASRRGAVPEYGSRNLKAYARRLTAFG